MTVTDPLARVEFHLYDLGPGELQTVPPEAPELHLYGAYANGRLPKSALASIGGGLYLRKDAAHALAALQAACEAKYGKRIRISDGYRPLGAPGDYRRGAWSQWAAWERYKAGGNLAAYPGTSNHGLGLAIDIDTRDRYMLDALGPAYGFSKSWSDAPSEPWHIKWKTGTYPKVEAFHNDPTLRPGHANNAAAVKRVKKLLRDAGVKKASGKHTFKAMSNDGVYGPVAVQRVKWFQEKVLGPHADDGIVGDKTWAALEAHAKKG